MDACASQMLSKCWGPAGVRPRGSSTVMSTQPDMNFGTPLSQSRSCRDAQRFLGHFRRVGCSCLRLPSLWCQRWELIFTAVGIRSRRSQGTGGNSPRWCQGWFRLDTGENFSMERVSSPEQVAQGSGGGVLIPE